MAVPLLALPNHHQPVKTNVIALAYVCLQAFHIGTQHRIHPRLISLPPILEPIQHIAINANRDRFLRLGKNHFGILPKLGPKLCNI